MTQLAALLNRGTPLERHQDSLVEAPPLRYRFFPCYRKSKVEEIANSILQKLSQEPSSKRGELLKLGERLISRYGKAALLKKSLKRFDRALAPYKENIEYQNRENQTAFEKWVRAGQPPEIFRDHPLFASFLEKSQILSQMKVTRDQVRLIDQVPKLWVEDRWLSLEELENRFELIYSKLYGQLFVVEKETRCVYTYLDNGKGLQKHHPFLSTTTPISKLEENDYQKTLAKAKEFIRPEETDLSSEEREEKNKNRTFILQLVSSYDKKGSSNFSEFVQNRKHPYLRLIIGADNPELRTHRREVYEVGYGWKSPPLLPFIYTQGRFRSPDIWEYKNTAKRIVTNIALSQEEARRFYLFTLKYHLDGIHLGKEPAFHLLQQNCSVYFRAACAAAGIGVPTEASLGETLYRIAPDILRKPYDLLNLGLQKISRTWSLLVDKAFPENFFKGLTPTWLKIKESVKDFFNGLAAFIAVPFRALLGEGSGQGGVVFGPKDQEAKKLEPPLRSWKNFFTLPKLNFPGISQEWQLKQPSTVVYENPVKLAIVP